MSWCTRLVPQVASRTDGHPGLFHVGRGSASRSQFSAIGREKVVIATAASRKSCGFVVRGIGFLRSWASSRVAP